MVLPTLPLKKQATRAFRTEYQSLTVAVVALSVDLIYSMNALPTPFNQTLGCQSIVIIKFFLSMDGSRSHTGQGHTQVNVIAI